MPAAITAGTGMDAFAHCLEAFCSPHYHPMSLGIALEGMRLVKENLTTAYDTPSDLDARAHMMSAAMMGATAFQKGLGAIHAVSHPVGALYGTHHGTTNAVVMRAVLAANRGAIEGRLEQAAAYLGIEGGFDGFDSFVGQMNARLNIPESLAAMGVTSPDREAILQGALKDPSCGGNPIEMTESYTADLLDRIL